MNAIILGMHRDEYNETNNDGIILQTVATASDRPKDVPATSNHIQPDDKLILPKRKNLRAEFHNYSGGDYFVTICALDKVHYFGDIVDGKMHFSAIGKFAHDALENLAYHYKYAEAPLFVVMPNHVHAIISIREQADAPWCVPTVRTALSVVVGGYKQSVTCFARRNSIEFGWQSRFHDHIIRGANDGNIIAEYIKNNIASWAQDCFNTK